jgi:NAD(P)-dependent dehydrogenase (short-subunit alcohol dehydrogenase family)
MSAKVALVTGGSRGLGRSIAGHLARSGVSVIITYRDEDRARAVIAEVTGMGVKGGKLRLDVTDFGGYDRFAKAVRELLQDHFGQSHLDYLVNNAGAGYYSPFESASQEKFDEIFALNVKAPYFLTQALLETLTDGSRVLNLTTATTRGVVPGLSAYAASKGAVEVLTRYLAVELGGRGIRVNALMGGAIDDTDFLDGMMRSQEVATLAAQQSTLGRIGHADELASAVPAILSDSFAWATGSLIDVSGGQDLRASGT